MHRPQITVFGGSGFIGRHIVRRLADRGAMVQVAVRDPIAAAFLKPMGDVGQIVPLFADVGIPESVASALAGSNAVINLVGILAPAGRNTFEHTQAIGAGNVARAAAVAGAKHLIHMSAIGANANGKAAYARTKGAGEEAVRAAFPQATILRPSVVFGPEDNFFNQFASLARLLPALPVFGGRNGPRFQPVYVSDVADAAVTAAFGDTAAGKTYELGGPRIYTFRQILERVLTDIGRRRPLISIPLGLAAIAGAMAQILPKPLLTRDQVLLMKRDNVVSQGALTLADLGIEATAAEAILPGYLRVYRRPRHRA
jgi:uncharacterized protein YbjT (DUF2867 family)